MAGLQDYQFFSDLRERDTPFWQRIPGEEEQEEEKDHPMNTSPYHHPRRPTEFPDNLLNPGQGSVPSGARPAHPRPPPPQFQDPHRSNELQMEKYGELSISIVSLCAENLLSHPFIVVRRQCQVNVNSQRYHVLPITVVPALIHMQGCQGFSSFWKGLGSVLTVRGVTLALEDCLSKFTPWPKEISPHSSLKSIGQHLLLKCSALALVTPFYSASLVETVQSEIASERPGVFDVFKEGLTRLLSFTHPQTGRMLPVWLLILPTVSHGILQYIIGNAASTISSQILRRYHRLDQQKQGAVSKDTGALMDATLRLQSAFMGHMVADVILYPLETVLHRLHMQGTRTIIDSLDVGYEVKPILTRYEGFFDCFTTMLQDEGCLGLFKGFGALCIQYAAYGAVLKFAQVIIREVTLALVPPKPKPKPQDLVAPLTPTPPYTSNLHPSPHRQAQGSPWLGGEVWGAGKGTPSHKRQPGVDLRAELEKHKSNLTMED